MQYMVLFSHLTVQLPSVLLSQKQELAECKPAPFFCIMVEVTTKKKREKKEVILGILLENLFPHQNKNSLE